MTDGASDVRTEELPDAIANLKNAGVLIFTVGVGAVNENQLRQISSNLTNTPTYFYSPSFSVCCLMISTHVN